MKETLYGHTETINLIGSHILYKYFFNLFSFRTTKFREILIIMTVLDIRLSEITVEQYRYGGNIYRISTTIIIMKIINKYII